MSSGIGCGWNPSNYFGIKSAYWTASLTTVRLLHYLFPEPLAFRHHPRFPHDISQKIPLRPETLKRMEELEKQIFGTQPLNVPEQLEVFEVETEPLPEIRFDQSPEIIELEAEVLQPAQPQIEQPKENQPFQDQSLWDIATHAAASWVRGLLAAGIDPNTLEKIKDLGAVAGGFGLMFFLLYLARREQKTDYYQYNDLILTIPSDCPVKLENTKSLLELESALKKTKRDHL